MFPDGFFEGPGAPPGIVRFQDPPAVADAGGRAGDGEGYSTAAPEVKPCISFGINRFIKEETAADAHGHAQSARRSDDSDEGDLFIGGDA